MTTLKNLKDQKIIALTTGAWSNLAQKQFDFNILVRTRDLLKVLPALNVKPSDLPGFLNDYTYDDTNDIAQALINQHLPYWVQVDKFSSAVLSELETNYVFNNRTKRPFKPEDLK
jgi:hypothetical protein